jgi:hypothetical protein
VTYTTDGTALMIGTEGEQSPVERVAVEREPGSGGEAKSPGAPADGGKAAGNDEKGDVTTYGLLVLGGGAVLVLALRRRRG